MRWLHGIIDSIKMTLSKLKLVMDGKAWQAAVRSSQRSEHDWTTELTGWRLVGREKRNQSQGKKKHEIMAKTIQKISYQELSGQKESTTSSICLGQESKSEKCRKHDSKENRERLLVCSIGGCWHRNLITGHLEEWSIIFSYGIGLGIVLDFLSSWSWD